MTITILDGGMGKELRRIGAPFRQPEWSALALIESPDHVIRAHRNFIDAGAEMITTNNYAVVPFHLGDDGFAERGRELIDLAGRLARTAAAPTTGDDRAVRVAGSMPPLFGSYEPEHFDAERAAPIYRTIADALSPHVDLWLAETLSTTGEVDSILAAIERLDDGRPVWVGFAFPDRWDEAGVAIRSGEGPAAIAEAISRHPRIETVLVNCTIPEQTGEALRALRTALAGAGVSVATGAYANAFPTEETDPDQLDPSYRANNTIFERRVDLTPARYAEFVAEWVNDGASIIGGCCDMYPDHIAELAARFRSG